MIGRYMRVPAFLCNGDFLNVSAAQKHQVPEGTMWSHICGKGDFMSDIEVRHLSKSFDLKGVKVEALKDINLSIKPGDIYGIIGMSG